MRRLAWRRDQHYGITRKRAMELEGVKDYPRRSAALFHFDKLTKAEQATVRKYLKMELKEARENKKKVSADIKRMREVNRRLNVRPQRGYATKLRKDANDWIKSAEQRLRKYGG